MLKIGLAFAVSFVCLVQVAQAEIYECDGKWTNQPCESGKAQRTIHEVTRSYSPPEAPEVSAPAGDDVIEGAQSSAGSVALEPLAPRTDLIRKLRKQSDDYKRKGGVTLSSGQLEGFRRACEDRTKPFSDCLAAFNDQSQKLTALNQKQDQLQIDAQRNEIEADKVKAIRGR